MNPSSIFLFLGYTAVFILIAVYFYYEGQYRAKKEMIDVLIKISKSEDLEPMVKSALTMLDVIMKGKNISKKKFHSKRHEWDE